MIKERIKRMGFRQWAGAGLLIKLFENLLKGGKIDDAADALGIALCYLFQLGKMKSV